MVELNLRKGQNIAIFLMLQNIVDDWHFVYFFISLSTLFVCWFLYIFKHLVCFREMITATSSTSNEIAVLGKHFDNKVKTPISTFLT